jgi:hypothetical protein
MTKVFLVLAIAAGVAFSASPAFLQETEKPSQYEHGMMGGGMMQQAGMTFPMMGMGRMGSMGEMGGDPSMMGQMMQMRGEVMMKMGEVFIKYGKQMQQSETK